MAKSYSVGVLPYVRARGRFLLYGFGLIAAGLIDAATPEGVADWLIELILAWVASVTGSMRELVAVAAVGTLVIAVGLFTSPRSAAPIWMDLANRAGAIATVWGLVQVTAKRRAAEEDRRKMTRKVRALEGLLPICAGCKSIRTPEGAWRSLEFYLSEHSEAQLTHGLCPKCAAKFMNNL
jgi:hypothetical protein